MLRWHELILLCKLQELLSLGLCFIGGHLLDELILDPMLDEVVVFVGCPPFLHILTVEFRPEVAKRFASNIQRMPLAQGFIVFIRWILKIVLHVKPHFVL
jgi:hypothetical protein